MSENRGGPATLQEGEQRTRVPGRVWLYRRWADWPLSRKGLLVAAISVLPLLLTTTLYLVAAARERAAQELVTRTHQISSEFASLLANVLEAESTVWVYVMTGDPTLVDQYRAVVAQLDPRFERLAVLIQDPSQHGRLDRLRQAARHRIETLTGIMEGERGSASTGQQAAEAVRRLQDFRAQVADIEVAQQALLEDRRARAARIDRVVTSVVIAGGLLGIAGGISASVLMSSGIVSRVQTVRENAGRLVAGQPLLPGPPGSDEVAALNRSLEEGAALLHRREQELERRMQQLSAVNSELEAFSYSVSHDLRAPLRHVAGFASLLEKSAQNRLTETDRRFIKTIREAAARMGLLIDDLLSFSRMSRAEFRRRMVDLNALVDGLVAEASRDNEGRTINWTRTPLPIVQGDEAMLHVAMSNLVSNAVKYTSTRAVAEIEIGATQADGEHVIFVRDNGVGFDMTYVDKLFGVFQRLHNSNEFEGTGIGLANVQRVVQRHGGRVWAESELDRGTTFYVALPIEQEKE